MTTEEFLDALRQAQEEINAQASEVVERLADNQDRLVSFQLARADLSCLINKIEAEVFQGFASQLEALEDELQQGITAMNQSLQSLANVIKTVEAIGQVVGLATRVAALVT